MTKPPLAQKAPAPTDVVTFRMSRREAEVLHRRLALGLATQEEHQMLRRLRGRLGAALEGGR